MELKAIIRKHLDDLFIKSAPWRVSTFNYKDEGQKILNELKICLVKQETFPDLYTNPNLRGKDLLFSTFHRSGPLGLLHAKRFDFFILKLSTSEESCVWRFLAEDMNGPLEVKIRSFKDELFIKDSGQKVNEIPQSGFATPMSEIDWASYDIVISINFSVDEHIIKKHPKVLWCYILQEPSMRHYKWSGSTPLFSYDLFLNQKFTYRLSRRKVHEVNFPYNFMNSSTYQELVGPESNNRRGIFVEIHSMKCLNQKQIQQLESFGEVRYPREELFHSVLEKMNSSKYFFSLRGSSLTFKIWGNSMIDAVAAGLLAFGNPFEYHNIGLFTSFTCIASFDEFIEKISLLEKNPALYIHELTIQKKLLDKYCFYRPIKQISNAYCKKQNS